MQLKYHPDIKELSKCPDSTWKPADRQAYRFTINSPPNTKCFVPVGKDPKRIAGKNDDYKCRAFSISLYNTEENARAAYQETFGKRLKTSPNAWKQFGRYLAKGVIEPKDGLCSHISDTGHFSLHEAHDCELYNKFIVVGDLLS